MLVVSVPAGVPAPEWNIACLPMPAAFLNATTVSDTFEPVYRSVAVKERLFSLPLARADQTSVSPRPVFSRPTSVHFRPLDDTVAVWLFPAGPRPDTNATSRSPAAGVETLTVAVWRPAR